MGRICGAGIGFLAFSLSLIIGLVVGNSFTTVVLRAVVVLFLGYILGCTLFWVGQKVIIEHLEAQLEEAQQKEQDDNNQGDIDPDLYGDDGVQGVEQPETGQETTTQARQQEQPSPPQARQSATQQTASV